MSREGKVEESEMEVMRNSKDLEDAVQMARWTLRPIGLWPVKSTNYYSTILRSVAIAACSFLLIFLFVPNCLFMFLVVKDIRIRLKLVGPLSFNVMNICKYYGILFKHREICACIRTMALDWHEVEDTGEKSIMLKNARAAKIFAVICAIFMYGGGLPYTIILPIARGVVVVGNVSYRSFAYPSYFIFFNPHVRPNFDIVYTIHCVSGFVTFTVTIGLCSIAIVCILHICGQIGVTSLMLHKLAGNFDKKSLGKIVRKHISSLRFASKLEDMLTGMCCVEIAGCTFNMCMLGYYFITEYEESEHLGPFIYSLLLTSFTFNIFIFCYIGDLLTERCNSLKDAAYMVDWYQLPTEEARNIILIVASTERPVVLTAGKLITLSLRTFSNVVKVSATYLNMLRTVTANG